MSQANNQDTPSQSLPLHVRVKRIGIGILIAGLLGSAVIYFTANDGPDGAIGYEIVGGKAFPIMPGQYKGSQYQLERVGGKFAVVAAELDDWFGSLWQGKQLGITLAFLTAGIAGGCFFFAHLLSFQPPEDEAEDSGA
ncbi:MAG TPA: hypothetical protein VK832_06585 [Burkholderiaceae bacterium]|nr:hypothetical protein [Burkholderiaceae bacterium]